MPITIARIEDNPVILIARVTGSTSIEEFDTLSNDTADLIVFDSAPVFRIFDVRHVTVSVNEMLTAFKRIQSTATIDTHIQSVILGNSKWQRLLSEVLNADQIQQLPVPLFTTMEHALEHIDHCLERQPIG